MIGHDLIAWPPALPTRMGSQRWCRKVLTDSELTWHSEQSDPMLAAAMLWAAKEAAYKLAVKKGYPRGLRPRDFELGGIRSSEFGVRSSQGAWSGEFRFQSEEGYILALVAESERELERVEVRQQRIEKPTNDERSASVQQVLKELLAEKWPEQAGGFRLEKNAVAVPEVWLGSTPWPTDISLSHDGEWVSAAVVIN